MRVTSLLAVLIVILALVAASLIFVYHTNGTSTEGLPASPKRKALVSHISAFRSEWKDIEIRDFFEARPEPRSGVLAVHSVYNGDKLVGRLATVRHDIICSTCSDLLLGVLYDPASYRILEVLPLEPWHLEAGAYDPEHFLRQFVGRSLKDLDMGIEDIDGISGATYSVRATLLRLRELEDWIHSDSRKPSE
ncbi:MAG: FMN-binding protein [Candidatus Latescibacteria bacterium]|nr:FMN-binding protein [Candidatus Latescibacterota bacterium]